LFLNKKRKANKLLKLRNVIDWYCENHKAKLKSIIFFINQ
jgi:hypothetical protein